MEGLARERGIDMRTAGLAVFDSLWDEVKDAERTTGRHAREADEDSETGG
jgi:hypothetical protein